MGVTAEVISEREGEILDMLNSQNAEVSNILWNRYI